LVVEGRKDVAAFRGTVVIERPFFIVGAERSGTTLPRLMLDQHPLLACHFEFADFGAS
jgi:hypothetical protein